MSSSANWHGNMNYEHFEASDGVGYGVPLVGFSSSIPQC